MTVTVANTQLTDTFEYWRNRTNELADAMSTVVVTSSNPVTGNVEVTNQFTANVLVANSYIRGGDATTNGTLFISSNAQMSSGYSLSIETLSADNSTGLVNQVLFSGGPTSSAYWDYLPDTGVTQVNSGNGLTGGPITSTGTISVLAGTGIISNTSGVFVNPSYISTIDSGSVGGYTATSLRDYSTSEAIFYSSNATNITSGTLNNARLPSSISVTNLAGNGASITSVNADTVGGNTALDLRNYTDSVSPIGQQTIWIPAVAMYPSLTNGASRGSLETVTNGIVIQTLDFDTATKEYAQFAIQMPKGWNEGTLICQFIWSHSTTSTNFGVVWEIQGVSLANNNALDSAFGAAVLAASTGGTTDNLYITSETTDMTVAGSPSAEEYVIFRVSRNPANGSDTLGIDARLHGVKIHYTIDSAKDD